MAFIPTVLGVFFYTCTYLVCRTYFGVCNSLFISGTATRSIIGYVFDVYLYAACHILLFYFGFIVIYVE